MSPSPPRYSLSRLQSEPPQGQPNSLIMDCGLGSYLMSSSTASTCLPSYTRRPSGRFGLSRILVSIRLAEMPALLFGPLGLAKNKTPGICVDTRGCMGFMANDAVRTARRGENGALSPDRYERSFFLSRLPAITNPAPANVVGTAATSAADSGSLVCRRV